MNVDFDIAGIEQLRAIMRDLPEAAQRRVWRPSVRRGGRWIGQTLKRLAPRGPTGNLIRGAGAIKESRDGSIRIGFRARLAAHALLVDKGTGLRVTRAGANRGAARPNPFFDAALAQARSGASLLIRDTAARLLAQEARRYRLGHLNARGRIRPQFRPRRGR